jgi:hypothetical protein
MYIVIILVLVFLYFWKEFTGGLFIIKKRKKEEGNGLPKVDVFKDEHDYGR